MIKLCIFDLDGTLTNTMPTIAHYVNAAIGPLSVAMLDEEHLRHYVGDGATLLIKRALHHFSLPEDGAELERVLTNYLTAYDQSPLYLTEPYAGIKELLLALKKQGVRLAVLSNKPDFAAKQVVAHFFGDIFDIVRGACENMPLKPAPDGLLATMKELGTDKDETLMIGDTRVDIETGKNASVKTVGVLWGFRDEAELRQANATYIVKTPCQILNFLN